MFKQIKRSTPMVAIAVASATPPASSGLGKRMRAPVTGRNKGERGSPPGGRLKRCYDSGSLRRLGTTSPTFGVGPDSPAVTPPEVPQPRDAMAPATWPSCSPPVEVLLKLD